MVSLKEVKTANTYELYILIIIGALAFYLSLTFTEAAQLTVSAFTPDEPIVSAWLSFLVSVIVASLAIIFLMWYFHHNR